MCASVSDRIDTMLSVFVARRRADWRSGKRRGLRTKGPLIRDLAGSPFVVALRRSHLPIA